MSAVEQEYESPVHNYEAEFSLETYQQPSLKELARRLEVVSEVTEPCTFESLGIVETPLVWGEVVHAEINHVGSFKLRGSYYAMVEAHNNGVSEFVTASAGNHSQGTAFAAATLNSEYHDGTHVSIFMPESAPDVKRVATQRHGGGAATLSTDWDNFEDCDRAAQEFSEQTGAYYVSPFDNLDVIAGQGTVAYEALLDRPNADRLFVACGGGGLLAGTLETVAALKEAGKLKPSFKVVGVIFEGNDSLANTLAAKGTPQSASNTNVLCEGAAVDKIGEVPAALIWKNRDHLETVTVSPAELGAAAVAWEERMERRNEYEWKEFDKPETTGLLAEAGQLKLAKVRAFQTGKMPEHWLSVCTGSNVDEARWDMAKQAYFEALSADKAAEKNLKAVRLVGQKSCQIVSSPAITRYAA